MGGDYQEVISRLRSDRLVQKFVLKFLDDKSFELFCSSMESKNYEEAFRAVHTIKGICQNLALSGCKNPARKCPTLCATDGRRRLTL